MNTVSDAFLLDFTVADGVFGKWGTSLEPYLAAYGSPRKV
jgi:hypothetical protein